MNCIQESSEMKGIVEDEQQPAGGGRMQHKTDRGGGGWRDLAVHSRRCEEAAADGRSRWMPADELDLRSTQATRYEGLAAIPPSWNGTGGELGGLAARGGGRTCPWRRRRAGYSERNPSSYE